MSFLARVVACGVHPEEAETLRTALLAAGATVTVEGIQPRRSRCGCTRTDAARCDVAPRDATGVGVEDAVIRQRTGSNGDSGGVGGDLAPLLTPENPPISSGF
jgi:hypothetical protein